MNSQALKTIEDLSTVEYLSILINYLSVLQDGRTKPDTGSKGGYIRESVYNIDEIKEVKESINDTKKLVADRVIDYLDANIITDRWLDREENEDYQPLISILYDQRKDSI
jgi:hypothetical protein